MSSNKYIGELTFRSGEFEYSEENRSFSGYGIVFNSDSLPMRMLDDEFKVVEVVEQITPDAMRETDMSDVIAAFNHNFEKILGRTSSNTLQLSTDEHGIRYSFEVPKTSYGNDLLISSKRGDIKGSSFVFTMDWEQGYDITERSDGKLLAIPKKINKVYEMGPVVNPAYPETTAENRSGMLQDAVKGFLQQRKDEEIKEEQPELISDDAMNDKKKKLRLSEEEAR